MTAEPNLDPQDVRRPAWQLELEDGPLRHELGLPPKGAPAQEPLHAHQEALRFHGRGSEYFRIWAVNLFFTLITLGVYSAWAKVRKARWFAQHTSLGGDRFDYHADPKRILAGRVVAVGLLALWTFAFEFSPLAGLAVVAVFCIVGPMLFASAQRFKLANTSWRGLRFGFDVPRRQVYLVCVPLLLLWTVGSILQGLGVAEALVAASGLVTVLGLPWAHARLKQMQHHHANFGERRFSFTAAGPEFYGLYAKAIALAMVAGGLTVPVMMMIGMTTRGSASMMMMVLSVGLMVVLMWLMVWPYFAARMQQIVWAHTQLGPVRFAGTMKGWPLWRLVFTQTMLTLLTLGLYWPFAAVAIARYRVQSLVVTSPGPLDEVRALPAGDARRATGDAAADFFGLDLGW